MYIVLVSGSWVILRMNAIDWGWMLERDAKYGGCSFLQHMARCANSGQPAKRH